MASIKLAPFVSSARGEFGSHVFRAARGKTFIQARNPFPNPNLKGPSARRTAYAYQTVMFRNFLSQWLTDWSEEGAPLELTARMRYFQQQGLSATWQDMPILAAPSSPLTAPVITQFTWYPSPGRFMVKCTNIYKALPYYLRIHAFGEGGAVLEATTALAYTAAATTLYFWPALRGRIYHVYLYVFKNDFVQYSPAVSRHQFIA
jgi:hypothetical protein